MTDEKQVRQIVREELDEQGRMTRRGVLGLLGGGAVAGALTGSASGAAQTDGNLSLADVTADTYRISGNRYGGPASARSQLESELGSSDAGAKYLGEDNGALYHWTGSSWELMESTSAAVNTDSAFNIGPEGGILNNAVWADDGNIYDTIQTAYDNCSELIIIGQGVFEENFVANKSETVVWGQGQATVISGGSNGPAVLAGDGATENQQFRNFNVHVDQGSAVDAAVKTASDASNEFEFTDISVNEWAPYQGATVGFDVTNGAYSELNFCRSNFTSSDGFIMQDAEATACHADISIGGIGFDANDQTRLVNCEVTNASGTKAYELAGATAVGCLAKGSKTTYGHFDLKGRSVALACHSKAVDGDFAFDSSGQDNTIAYNLIEDCSATAGIRNRSPFDNCDVGPNTFHNFTGTDKYDVNGTGSTVKGVGTESADAETPTKSTWSKGDVVDFTDTGDGSGTGVYLLLPDETWSQIGT